MTIASLVQQRADRFFGVPRFTHATSEGPVDVPILYYEASNVVAVFHASRAGAERVLEGTGLAPQLSADGSALAALSFYEYRRTTVGVYNEVGTAILATPLGARRSRLGLAELLAPTNWRTGGAYVVDLPVTTAAANAAGREIWGYPKFVTDISFRLAKREFESTVWDPRNSDRDARGRIVTVGGRLGPGLPAPPMGIVTYSMLDGALLKTRIEVRGRARLHAPGSVRLDIGPSSHPMAQNLRTLGLEGAHARIVVETDHFRSRLPAGFVVMRGASPGPQAQRGALKHPQGAP